MSSPQIFMLYYVIIFISPKKIKIIDISHSFLYNKENTYIWKYIVILNTSCKHNFTYIFNKYININPIYFSYFIIMFNIRLLKYDRCLVK